MVVDALAEKRNISSGACWRSERWQACKLLRALRVTAVKFGLELASQPKARRDAKEATDARAALRKRWVVMIEKLGPGYRTKRGAEMPDWVAVAHLPSYKV